MNRLTEPVNSWISANGLMLWINKYHFIEFVSRVLSNPVRVQNAKATTVSSSSLLQQKTRDRRNVYHCLQEFRVQKEGQIKLYTHSQHSISKSQIVVSYRALLIWWQIYKARE